MFDNRRRAMRLNAPMLRAVIPAAARNTVFLDAFRSDIAEPVLGRLAEKAVELDAAFEVPDADATRDARVRALLSLMVGGFLSSMVLGDRPDEAIVDAALRVMGWSAVGPESPTPVATPRSSTRTPRPESPRSR